MVRTTSSPHVTRSREIERERERERTKHTREEYRCSIRYSGVARGPRSVERKKRHGRSAAGTRYSDTGRTDPPACSAVLMRLSAAVYAPLLGGGHVAGPYSNGVLSLHSLPPDTVSFPLSLSLSHSLELSALSGSRLLSSFSRLFPRRYQPSH